MKFGEFKFGEFQYGNSKNKYGIGGDVDYSLRKYLPPFLFSKDYSDEATSGEKNEFDALMDTILPIEIDNIKREVKINNDRFFLSLTDGHGLNYWEEMLGLKVQDESMSDKQRKSLVRGKLRGFGTARTALLQQVCETLSKGEVSIIEDNERFNFTVKFVGVQGIPTNLSVLRDELRAMKPAHLTFDFKFTYCLWHWIDELFFTWDGLRKYTWGQCKTELNKSEGGFQYAFVKSTWVNAEDYEYSWENLNKVSWFESRTRIVKRRREYATN